MDVLAPLRIAATSRSRSESREAELRDRGSSDALTRAHRMLPCAHRDRRSDACESALVLCCPGQVPRQPHCRARRPTRSRPARVAPERDGRRAPAGGRRRGDARRALPRSGRPADRAASRARSGTGRCRVGAPRARPRVVEMARASGLALVRRRPTIRSARRPPGPASSIRAAIDAGREPRDRRRRRLGDGGRRAGRARGARIRSPRGAEVLVACDVETTLPRGGPRVFGPAEGCDGRRRRRARAAARRARRSVPRPSASTCASSRVRRGRRPRRWPGRARRTPRPGRGARRGGGGLRAAPGRRRS